MINAQEYDKRLAKELNYHDFNNYEHTVRYNDAARSNRDNLYWHFRYRQGSYKAIKVGIKPCSVMMRFGNDKFRLFGNAENNKLFDKAKVILAGWKARSKADMRAEKLRIKLAKKNKGVITA